MTRVSTFSLIIAAAVLAVVAGVLLRISPSQSHSITNFEECAAAGYPIMESYPEQCATPDGRTFVREIPPISENTGSEGLGLQTNGCAVAGCSGQLCVSADEAGDIMSTCEFRAEYACYREASCEPQANGTCGWTPTAELQACLSNPPALNEVEGTALDESAINPQ